MQIRRFKELITSSVNANGLLLCHPNADPDAVSSAFVFSHIIATLNPEVKCEIASPEGPSEPSTRLLSFLRFHVVTDPKIEEADFFVLLDTSSLKQLGHWGERVKTTGKPLILVDHHAPKPDDYTSSFIDLSEEKARSTCEIVFRIGKDLGHRFGPEDTFALLFGIVFESKYFRIATPDTFRIAATLIESGADSQKAIALLGRPMTVSEKIARLKACQRMDLQKVDDWLLALTQVNSYQSSSARALLALGADIAIVVGGKKGKIRVSLRCTQEFVDKTGIHLGKDVAFKLGELLGGVGGGHPTTAGASGTGDIDNILKMSSRLILETLKRVKSSS